MGMQRWDACKRAQPRTEQEAALLALRIAVNGFAGFLAAVWAAGQRTLVEASLAALINNAFTVEPAVEAQSVAQEQQASPSFVNEHETSCADINALANACHSPPQVLTLQRA